MEAESLPSFKLRAHRETPVGTASDLLEAGTAICSREPRDEDAPGGKEAGTREIMDQRGRTTER